MISLFKYLRSIHPLSETLRDRLEDILKQKTLAKKEYLLTVGQLCRNIYFIEKGLLRIYYCKEGKEISSAFMKEGDCCVSTESFLTQQPGKKNIQAMEDCMLYYISYEELQQIYADFIEFNIIGRKLLEKCLLHRRQYLYAMWMQPAMDRYKWFYSQSPELFQRVPAKYLASHMGMTEGMLSVIRTTKLERR